MERRDKHNYYLDIATTVLERIILLSKSTGNKDLKKLINNSQFLTAAKNLQKIINYLNNTASSFEAVEQDLISKM